MALNASSAASGAGTGAIYGGMYGGPVGAGVGAVAGGVLGLFNKRKKRRKVSTLDPTQQRIYNEQAQALEGGGGPMADIYGQFDPAEMTKLWQSSYAQPAYQNYQENIVPTITGQFRGQNMQNSSYMGGALAKEGTRVQQDLDAKLQNMLYQGREANINRRQKGYSDIMNTQTFASEKPGPTGIDALLSQAGGHAIDMLTDIMSKRYGGGDTSRTSQPTPQVSGYNYGNRAGIGG